MTQVVYKNRPFNIYSYDTDDIDDIDYSLTYGYALFYIEEGSKKDSWYSHLPNGLYPTVISEDKRLISHYRVGNSKKTSILLEDMINGKMRTALR
jgi:hypothetical protein